jgi:c-di-GMP-related signal transduction protein
MNASLTFIIAKFASSVYKTHINSYSSVTSSNVYLGQEALRFQFCKKVLKLTPRYLML